MTEEEVLKKLKEYKNFIINLQQENKSLKETVENLKISVEEFTIATENGNQLLIERAKKIDELSKELEELKKQKTRKKRTVKPKEEKKPEETKWNIEIPTENGEKTITVTGIPLTDIQEEVKVQNTEPNHRMVVKSAEKELAEMIGES